MPLPQQALDDIKALHAVLDEIKSCIFERNVHLDMLALALMTGENVYVLGPPGTAKTQMSRLLCAAITGANYFDIQLDRFTPPDAFFGPIDVKTFRDTGRWQRSVEGYAPTSHIAFVDEIGKAGPTVHDPMLTWMLDKIFHNGAAVPMHCPLITLIGASNEELEMPEGAAFWDRFLIRLVVDYIQEPSNFAAMMLRSAPRPTAEVSLDQIMNLQAAVDMVTLPPGVVDSLIELRVELLSKELTPSDRRWNRARQLLKASALFAGRDTVDDDDLARLCHVLWDDASQIPEVERLVLAKTGPVAREAMKYDAQLDDIEKEINARQGQSVSERARYGGQANNNLREITERIAKVTERANRQGRSTDRLDAVQARVRSLQRRVMVECLNVPSDRAGRM